MSASSVAVSGWDGYSDSDWADVVSLPDSGAYPPEPVHGGRYGKHLLGSRGSPAAWHGRTQNGRHLLSCAFSPWSSLVL